MSTVLSEVTAFTWIHTPNVSALQWGADEKSVVRQFGSWFRQDICLYMDYRGCPQPPYLPHDAPSVRINGSGKFFVLHFEDHANMGPNYRHLLVQGRSGGATRFYHLNTEHAISDSNTEIRNASNVSIYGLKSEGRYNVLWIRDSDSGALSAGNTA